MSPAVHIPETDHLVIMIHGPGDAWWVIGCIQHKQTFVTEDEHNRGGVEDVCPWCHKRFKFTRQSAMVRTRETEATRQQMVEEFNRLSEANKERKQ